MWVRSAWKQRVLGNCRAGFITRSVMTTRTRRRAFCCSPLAPPRGNALGIAWKQGVFWKRRAGFITRSVMTTRTRRRAFLVGSSALRRFKSGYSHRDNQGEGYRGRVKHENVTADRSRPGDSFVPFGAFCSIFGCVRREDFVCPLNPSLTRRTCRAAQANLSARGGLAPPKSPEIGITDTGIREEFQFPARAPRLRSGPEKDRLTREREREGEGTCCNTCLPHAEHEGYFTDRPTREREREGEGERRLRSRQVDGHPLAEREGYITRWFDRPARGPVKLRKTPQAKTFEGGCSDDRTRRPGRYRDAGDAASFRRRRSSRPRPTSARWRPTKSCGTKRPTTPKEFWGNLAGELHWFKPFSKVLEWNEPFAKWFVGGQTNASLQLPRRASRHAAQEQGGHHLGRRAGRAAHAHLPAAAPRGLQVRQRAEGARASSKGDVRHDLHADDARAGHRHAGLRADRRGPLASSSAASRPRRSPTATTTPRPKLRHHGRRRLAARQAAAAEGERRCGPGQVAHRRELHRAAARGQRSRTCRRAATLWWHELMRDASADCPAEPLDSENAALHPLHQRLDRQTEGHQAHDGRLQPVRQENVRVGLRPSRRGHLLVHGRLRLGHRAQLHRLRPALRRRDAC